MWKSWALLILVVLVAVPAAAQEPMPMSAALPDSLATAADDSLSTGELPPTVNVEVPTPDYWTTGVSSTAAVLMTPVFPGWGQLYTDNNWKGALAFGLEMFYWTNLLVRDRRAVRAKDFSRTFEQGNINRDRYDAIAQEDWEQMRDFAWWSGGVLLIIALDSYVGAHLFNFDRDAVPVPNDWEGQFDPLGDGVPTQAEGPSLVVFQHGWRF
jgi:hypothetical protein|nr:DUF5683 domain-containing protein [Candidatus Krumholzibacteria bacterium]